MASRTISSPGHVALIPSVSPAKRDPDWRARHGIGADELVVLHVSRLVREKRLDTLTAALNRIAVPHRVVSSAMDPIAALPSGELPHAIFTGFLNGEELAAAYASSDIFVFPSDSESFGNVTLEAMAAGLPCVAADATGSRSLVVAGETGFLAPADNAAAFAAHITRLAQRQPCASAWSESRPRPRPDLFLGGDDGARLAGLLSRGLGFHRTPAREDRRCLRVYSPTGGGVRR